MSGFAEYEGYDALGLAELVRRRQVSAGELLDAAIARVEARNPSINAVTMPRSGLDTERRFVSQVASSHNSSSGRTGT